jgi:hypothetical protein
MKTKNAFPRTYEWLQRNNPELVGEFGQPDLNWTLDASTNHLRNSLIWIQQTCEGDFDRLTGVSDEALQDILALRQTASPEASLILNLLQIDLSLSVMGTATVQKRLQSVFDWSIYSICDTYPYQSENHFEISRIVDLFIRSKPSLYLQFGREIGLEWIKFFYYYVFKVGGLKELARLLAPYVMSLLSNILPEPDAIEASTRFAEWSIRDHYTDRTVLIYALYRVFAECHTGTQTHLHLGGSFALLIGEDIGLDTRELAREMLKTYKGVIPASLELQLLQASTVPDANEIMRKFDEILTTIRRYRTEVLSVGPDKMLFEYEFERSFVLISALVLSLLKAADANAVATVLAAWNGHPAESARQDVLFVLTNEGGGLLFSRQGARCGTDSQAHSNTFVELIRAINSFHGTNIVLNDDDTLAPHVPTRPGLPEDPVQSSIGYLAAMRNQFCFFQEREFLEQSKRAGVGGLKLVPGLPCPIQPLMIRDIGFSWPIASSMLSPDSDRKCEQVLIWTGGTFIAELQANWIADSLQQHAQVTIATGGMDQFRAEFSRPHYDAIWITSHCEFDHIDPHRGGLAICEGVEMKPGELANIAIPTAGRRLLILDACDSGAVPVYGGLSDFGFGPLLVSRHQAVISYRWPVEQLASALFNVLLAIGLRSNWFYAAFEFAVGILIEGKERILHELRGTLGDEHELIGRVRNNESIRWKALGFWGSAAFLE